MERKIPLLFEKYPNLKNKVPWIPLLDNIPSPIDRLSNLENYLGIQEGAIYIKRDDKDHRIYGGNKLRKFEFLFGKAVLKKRRIMATIGSIGTNHGLACAIIAKTVTPPLKCHLFLVPQPLTWHVQRSLLLFNRFGPIKFHYAESDSKLALKLLLFKIFRPRSYIMMPGGSLFLGMGTAIGTLGFIEAALELKSQIDQKQIPEPDAIFVPGASTGTAAGLIVGCKLLGLKTKIYAVAVSAKKFASEDTIIQNCEKAIKYLVKVDNSFPNISITKDDFKMIYGYLGSNYGVVTEKSQAAVDVTMRLEGDSKGFIVETSYTGKTLAAMFDFFQSEEKKSKIVLFWNTYNSNDMDSYLKETNFDWEKLPKKLHKYYENTSFQCWQILNCPKERRENCEAYLNREYRCWKVKGCSEEERKSCKAFEKLSKVIELEK